MSELSFQAFRINFDSRDILLSHSFVFENVRNCCNE